MPLADKLRLMEVLWEELRTHVEDLPVSEHEKKLLDQRRRAVEAGEEPVLDWEDVKDKLGRI